MKVHQLINPDSIATIYGVLLKSGESFFVGVYTPHFLIEKIYFESVHKNNPNIDNEYVFGLRVAYSQLNNSGDTFGATNIFEYYFNEIEEIYFKEDVTPDSDNWSHEPEPVTWDGTVPVGKKLIAVEHDFYEDRRRIYILGDDDQDIKEFTFWNNEGKLYLELCFTNDRRRSVRVEFCTPIFADYRDFFYLDIESFDDFKLVESMWDGEIPDGKKLIAVETAHSYENFKRRLYIHGDGELDVKSFTCWEDDDDFEIYCSPTIYLDIKLNNGNQLTLPIDECTPIFDDGINDDFVGFDTTLLDDFIPIFDDKKESTTPTISTALKDELNFADRLSELNTDFANRYIEIFKEKGLI